MDCYGRHSNSEKCWGCSCAQLCQEIGIEDEKANELIYNAIIEATNNNHVDVFIILKYIFTRETLDEIGTQLGITRQRVHQRITRMKKSEVGKRMIESVSWRCKK